MSGQSPPVPPYVEPDDYAVNGSWTRCDEREEHSVTVRPGPTTPEKTHSFAIRNNYDILTVEILSDDISPVGFWTIVHYCRDYGVPGVWKERLMLNGYPFRLGALYCIGDFELTERETNYQKYGEFPYEMED